MKNHSTPGIYSQEVDLSEIVAPVGTSTGGTVVMAVKGPINRPVLCTSDKDYFDTFGTPIFVSGDSGDNITPEYGYGQYVPQYFLQESNALYVVRGYGANDYYSTLMVSPDGTTATSGVPAAQDSDSPDSTNKIYTLDSVSTTGKSLLIGSVGPGTYGNNLAVTINTFSSACDWVNNYDTYTSATPTTANRPIAAQVFKLSVYTKGDGDSWTTLNTTFSSWSASPDEVFYGTRTSQQDGNKKQLFIDDVVNGVSQFIYVNAGNSNFTSTCSLSAAPVSATPLLGGASGISTGIGSTTGWSYFNNKEDLLVNILICPDYSANVKQEVAGIAATRKDCIAVGQSGSLTATNVTNVKAAELYGYTNPSYMALYAGYDQIYDSYNDKVVYLPKSIFGAVLMARVDNVANTWDSPAGINVGILPSLTQNRRWSFNEIGQLYDASINTSRHITGSGDVMWGQRTAQLKNSALRDINVRRLLLLIENSIERSLLPFIFALNNDSTRLRVWNICDSFLSSIQGGGGLEQYKVVCDTSNNTPQVIDNNTLAVNIYITPVRAIYFIELTTVVTRTGVSFSEIIGG